jgi:hypothetical protein
MIGMWMKYGMPVMQKNSTSYQSYIEIPNDAGDGNID